MTPSFKLILGGLAIATGFTTLPTSKAFATCNEYPFISTICWTSSYYCPDDYAEANGQYLAINTNQALYSLIGTRFGGDGRTTFALPDLRGRAAIGTGQGPGLTNISLGQRVGQENITLGIPHLPKHKHTVKMGKMPFTGQVTAVEETGTAASPANAFPAARPTGGPIPGRKMYYTNSTDAGEVTMAANSASLTPNPSYLETEKALGYSSETDNEALPLRPPQIGVLACIALKGEYPPRN